MKKTGIFIFALLFALPIHAWQTKAAGLFAASPALISGAYYAGKTVAKKARKRRKGERPSTQDNNLRSFAFGLLGGVWPGVNAGILYAISRDWKTSKEILLEHDDTSKSIAYGFAAGLASYGTTVAALKWLKKVK